MMKYISPKISLTGHSKARTKINFKEKESLNFNVIVFNSYKVKKMKF